MCRLLLEPMFGPSLELPMLAPDSPVSALCWMPGAGVASLVARELKASRAACYRSLQCIALSPPPSISPAAAAACSAFVTSVTVEEDLVSRLSWRSLQLLRARALEALLLCRQPKWQVRLCIVARALDSSKTAGGRISGFVRHGVHLLRRFRSACEEAVGDAGRSAGDALLVVAHVWAVFELTPYTRRWWFSWGFSAVCFRVMLLDCGDTSSSTPTLTRQHKFSKAIGTCLIVATCSQRCALRVTFFS